MTRFFDTSSRLKKHLPLQIIAVTAAIFFVLSASFGEFLHNHGADFEDHHDCPVHVLFHLLSTVLIVVFHFYVILGAAAKTAVNASAPILLFSHPTHGSRAPPSFF